MQTLPISVPDPAYQQWERLSETEKQTLEKRLNRALGAFLFQKNSSLIQHEMQGRGPYQSEEELFDGVS